MTSGVFVWPFHLNTEVLCYKTTTTKKLKSSYQTGTLLTHRTSGLKPFALEGHFTHSHHPGGPRGVSVSSPHTRPLTPLPSGLTASLCYYPVASSPMFSRMTTTGLKKGDFFPEVLIDDKGFIHSFSQRYLDFDRRLKTIRCRNKSISGTRTK